MIKKSCEESIKKLFYISDFDESLKQIRQQLANDTQLGSQNLYFFQILQQICKIEQGEYQDGLMNLNNLVTEREKQVDFIKGEIFLYSRIMLQKYYFKFDKYLAEQNNSSLLQACQMNNQEYSQKNQLFILGMGYYNLVDNYKNSLNQEYIKNLILYLNQFLHDKTTQEKTQEFYIQEIMFLIAEFYGIKHGFESKTWYEKLQSINPMFPSLCHNLAFVYHNIYQNSKAQKLFQNIEIQQPKNIVYLKSIAQYYKEIGKKVKAIEYFELAYKINPKDSNISLSYGVFLIDNNQISKGLKLLYNSIENNPNCCEIYLYLSKFEDKNKRYKNSIDLLQKCIEFQPKEGYHYYLMGIKLYKQQVYEKSSNYLQDALSLKLSIEEQHEACYKLANCLYSLKRYEESLEYYLNAYQINIESNNLDKIQQKICKLLDINKEIPLNKKLEIVDSFNGISSLKFKKLLFNIENKRIQLIIEKKIVDLVQIMQIYTYRNNIQPSLQYQQLISHWDLYLN